MLSRIFSAVVLLAVTAVLLVAAWPQLFGLENTWIIAQVVSLRGLAIVAALCCVVVVLVLRVAARRFRPLGTSIVVLLLAFCLASAGILVNRGIGTAGAPAPGPATVSVLSWNTQGSKPDTQAVADLAVKSRADVVSLPETTETDGVAIAVAMRAAGHPMWVHTIAYDLDFHARSTTLLISPTLGDYQVVSSDQSHSTGNTYVLPTVVAKPASGNGPTIVAVHAVSPTPGEMMNWRSDLNWLAGQCDGSNVIMAGDFNSTLDHMWGLGATGSATLGNCADAAARSSHAGVGTWPTTLPPLLGTPIDHVMATANWKVDGMQVIQTQDASGSMHRPLLVRLSPAS